MLACAVIVGLCFSHIDVRVAVYMASRFRHLTEVSEGFGGLVLVSLEAVIFIVLALIRILHGKLPRFGIALALACLASICTYGVNSTVLKPIFGVAPPYEVLQGAPHLAFFLQGTPNSAFPSGHMALAGAFGGVFMRFWRFSIVPLSLLLAFGALILVMGNWHFVSDVIAGSFIGVSAGLLAAEVWFVHTGRNA